MKRTLLFLTYLLVGVSLYATTQHFDLVVSLDGTGNYTSVQEAINAVRDYRPEGRTRILIKNGIYKEKVVVPSTKTNISLIGENCDSTIISWNDHAQINNLGTFKSYTLKAEGLGFEAENLTIENCAEPVAQAVALHIESDKAAFRNCRFLGNQDTVFNGNEQARQYFESCYIEGTTDFIFGPAAAWFENCTIHSKRNSYITAASTPAWRAYGYIFNNCRLTADKGVNKVYLGRPWRAHAATLFMNCHMGEHIIPEGWHNWRDPEREKTARYLEYNNDGPGADRSKRVAWSRELTKKEYKAITLKKMFEGTPSWNPIVR